MRNQVGPAIGWGSTLSGHSIWIDGGVLGAYNSASWQVQQVRLPWRPAQGSDPDENLKQINQALRIASKPHCGIEALEALDRVPGIGLATATPILTVCYPGEFTILDWRVFETLQEAKKLSADDWTASTYMKEYLPKVREQQVLWDCSLRDADRALWGLSVRKRINEPAGAADGSPGEMRLPINEALMSTPVRPAAK
jgi:hypothetical protein